MELCVLGERRIGKSRGLSCDDGLIEVEAPKSYEPANVDRSSFQDRYFVPTPFQLVR